MKYEPYVDSPGSCTEESDSVKHLTDDRNEGFPDGELLVTVFQLDHGARGVDTPDHAFVHNRRAADLYEILLVGFHEIRQRNRGDIQLRGGGMYDDIAVDAFQIQDIIDVDRKVIRADREQDSPSVLDSVRPLHKQIENIEYVLLAQRFDKKIITMNVMKSVPFEFMVVGQKQNRRHALPGDRADETGELHSFFLTSFQVDDNHCVILYSDTFANFDQVPGENQFLIFDQIRHVVLWDRTEYQYLCHGYLPPFGWFPSASDSS